MRRLSILPIALTIAVLFSSLSCTDQGSDPTAPPPPPGTDVSFSQHIQPIFNGNGCTSCHGGSGGLFLTAGQSYANLVNVNAQASCTTLKRVLPGNPDQSVLYIRTSSDSPNTQCGTNSRMPQGSPRLPQATIDLIKDWINQGAKNN
ncbi:MAG TPA: hypothetical protein VII11_03755 [Bacteroidota bacterium]